MRSFADAMIMAPDADTIASTWSSAPSTPSRRRYPSATSAVRNIAHETSTLTSALKPSTTTAWSTAVKGPWPVTSAHCHSETASAAADTAIVADVASRTRT